MAFAPFGEGYAGGKQWIQFTSTGNALTVADNENQTGSLEDFMFRRYSPSQGRWISPDPAGMGAVNPASPQSWNRYAYVLNGPLNSTDPSGLHSINDCLGCIDDNFGDPNATTYIVNGVQVAPIFAQNILGVGSGGFNSFSSSSFFFNAGTAMNASAWSVLGGDLYGTYGYFTPNPGYNPNVPGSVLGTSTSVLVDLGSISAGAAPPANNGAGPGAQRPQQNPINPPFNHPSPAQCKTLKRDTDLEKLLIGGATFVGLVKWVDPKYAAFVGGPALSGYLVEGTYVYAFCHE